MLLSQYTDEVRDLLHDPNANFYSVPQVTRWINRARRQVAEKGRCVRILPPPSGSVQSITVNSGGSGYTTATVEISAPDATSQIGNVQATATATVMAGAVTGFTITNAGGGYVAPATVTITGDGTGAIGTPVLSNHITTVPNQEIYSLATVAASMGQLTPGLGSLIGVQSISVSWGSVKPTLQRCSFSALQAYCRSVALTYQNFPNIWAQYGQGVTGNIYLFPIPLQYSAMEMDCYFSVLDLSDVQTVDLIPAPFDQAVSYYAAYLAYMNAQRPDDARTALGEHERLLTQARAVVTTDVTPDPYGDQY